MAWDEKLRESLRGGGNYLSAMRNWLLWHKRGSDRLTWGSSDEVTLTVKELEEMALEIAVAAESDIKRARYTFPNPKDA